jgi:pimeloyl-ACP methyl ester carboxylesterase
MLLIMGLGVQMLGWDERFCRRLSERGFRVVRFDNRDVGHSTHLHDAPTPNLMAALAGDTSSAAYTLEDMADDAAGLIDHLGAEAAHVVGASLGGMVAQTLAARHPERVLSLASIMSSTGNRTVGQPLDTVLPVLLTPPPADRDAFVENSVRTFRAIGSPGYPIDERGLRALARASYDRSYDPAGVGRQLVAILASGDRTEALRSIEAPTVVIHGEEDPLIQVSGGDATARAIEGAKLVRIPGMGHDLPEALWPTFIDEIAENAARAPHLTRG